MTRTHDAVGAIIDQAAASVATNLAAERKEVLQREDHARAAGEVALAQQLAWERGIIDLIVPEEKHYSLFHGAEFSAYAEYYGLTDETLEYARERARETSNLLLRVHHLEYALERGPQNGREWFVTQQQLADEYRELIDTAANRITGQAGRLDAVYLSRWMARWASLITVRGLLRKEEQNECAHWVTGIATTLRSVQWEREDGIELQHRWPYEILEHLAAIPADAIAEADRATALDLLQQAYDHYCADPLADTFVSRIAEVDAALRKHFGETDTHMRMVRRQYEALLRSATFHREHGSGLIAQSFFRQARKLVEKQRQYFDAAEVDGLQHVEREALEAAEMGGEFKTVTGGHVTINFDDFDRRQATPTDTVRMLMALRRAAIPDYVKLEESASRIMRENPLQFLFGASTVDRGKVVSEARTEKQHRRRVVQKRTSMHAEFVGLEVVVTLVRAANAGQITAVDVVRELGALGLDEQETEILERGIERFLAEDYISAGHILSSKFENAFRNKLTEVGVEPTRFRTLPDGTTRTDEATLGDLMHSSAPDGRTVRELIGEDAWQFIDRTMVAVDGWNLRNRFAHGLAGRRECLPLVVGVIVHHILWLATLKATPQPADDSAALADGAAPNITDESAAPSNDSSHALE